MKTPKELRRPPDLESTAKRRGVSKPSARRSGKIATRDMQPSSEPRPTPDARQAGGSARDPFEPDDDDDELYNAPTVQRVFEPLVGLFDDDEDEDEEDENEITMVGEMPEEIKALRAGWRKKKPPAIVVDDRPDIEIHFEQEVDPLLVEELLEDGPVDETKKINVLGHGATDVGQRRKVNQDAALVMSHQQTFVIADGMGGHVAGEIASGLCVDTIEEAIRTDTYQGEPHMLWPQLGDELARSIEQANLRIFGEAGAQDLQGMGTTVTAIRFSLNRQRLYIGHVGDSRCYRIRGESILQLTQDHTIANLMGVDGPIGQQLSRAVGVEPTVEVDLLVDVPDVGDRYLLCTDGLTKMLDDEGILSIVLEHKNLARAVDALIDAANYFGGKDNIGVVLVEVFPAAKA